jgi:membrane complex biogenesis BtpA family protein
MLRLSRERPLLIGVVHLLATPGAPRFAGDLEAVLFRAVEDARALARGGCDALIVENLGDVPFFARRVPPETVAAMALALRRVGEAAPGLQLGVNVLRNDARAALGLCAATGAGFLRVNVHTGAAVGDQGLLVGRAAHTLRTRARLCPGASLLCDVHVKHASPLGGETVAEAAADLVQRGLADVLVVSGAATGRPPSPERVAEVRSASGAAPVLIGSGLVPDNAAALLEHADGAIVGTWLKRAGRVDEPVELERVVAVRAALDATRG